MLPKWLIAVIFVAGTLLTYGFVDKMLSLPVIAMLPYLAFLVLAFFATRYYLKNFHHEWLLTGPAIILLLSIVLSLSVRQYRIWQTKVEAERLYRICEEVWIKNPPYDGKMSIKYLVKTGNLKEEPKPPFGGEYLTPRRGKIGFAVPGGLWNHILWYDGERWSYEH